MILHDTFEETLWPIFAFKLAFEYPDGIYSPIERTLKQTNKKTTIQIIKNQHPFFRPVEFYQKYNPYIQNEKKNINSADVNTIQKIKPIDLLENFPKKMIQDISLFNHKKFLNNKRLKRKNFCIEGSKKELFIHPTAEISKTTCINVEDGPVIISKNVKISAFSFLKGPLFIGKNSQLDNVNISNTRVGSTCRLGGEIADSLIGDFSNKHHEGFLGHSIVGDWVNLGALTTTSDLKNNYGIINLNYKGESFSAETIKFGSIIGDFVKTSIGTMLNTGTIIDVGSLLFSGRKESKYYPPFFWGGVDSNLYDLNRFINDVKKIMLRRNIILSEEKKLLIENYYNSQITI